LPCNVFITASARLMNSLSGGGDAVEEVEPPER